MPQWLCDSVRVRVCAFVHKKRYLIGPFLRYSVYPGGVWECFWLPSVCLEHWGEFLRFHQFQAKSAAKTHTKQFKFWPKKLRCGPNDIIIISLIVVIVIGIINCGQQWTSKVQWKHLPKLGWQQMLARHRYVQINEIFFLDLPVFHVVRDFREDKTKRKSINHLP